MLQSIRDRAQGWIAWVIVIFISIPFALWGINEYLGVGGEPVVAEVEGVEITQRELDNTLNRYRSRLREQFGGKIPEMFSDEIRVRCPHCRQPVHKDTVPSCVEWCAQARECLGEERWRALRGESEDEEGSVDG